MIIPGVELFCAQELVEFRLKVLLLTHEFPPYIFGGIGTFSSELATALCRKNLEVTVVAGCPSSALARLGNKRSTVTQKPRVIRIPKIDIPPNHLWFQLMNLNGLRKLVSGFDVIHGMDSSSFPLIYLCTRMRAKPPWVVTVNTGPVSELYYAIRSIGRGGAIGDLLRYGIGFPAWDAIIRGDMKYADTIVPVSESLSTELRNSYPIDLGKVSTIHTGVDIKHLQRVAEKPLGKPDHATSKKIRLFWAGRLTWRKGIVHLLKSLSYLAHEIGFTAFELEIFGLGPLEATIRKIVSLSGLSQNVRFRGFVEYADMISSMRVNDVVCFPSLYEACPLGLIEAMALGKPVIAFDRPFSRELMGNDQDLPMAKSIEDYARNVLKLSLSVSLRDRVGERLRARARDIFDIAIIADEYSKVYQKVIVQ